MLFKVVSVLVACTASGVTTTTSTPSSTLASSTPTSTTTASRILKRQLNAKNELENKLKKFNPIEFHSSTFVKKINYEEFGTDSPIGKWGAKVATILGFVGLSAGLVCGVLHQVLTWTGIFEGSALYYSEISLVNTAFASLLLPNLYGMWKVTSARKAYIIMLIVDVVSYVLYGSMNYGTLLGGFPVFVQHSLSIAAQFALAFVFLFNWYKVLYPTWTGIKDW